MLVLAFFQLKKKVIKAIQLVLILMEVFKKQIPLFYKNMHLAKYVPFLSALHELLDDLL